MQPTRCPDGRLLAPPALLTLLTPIDSHRHQFHQTYTTFSTPTITRSRGPKRKRRRCAEPCYSLSQRRLIYAQVKAIAQRLTAYGINTLKEPQITYALRSRITNGDVKEATELLVLFEDSVDGILREYNPKTKLLGAENRCAVTCYLDSLLFAMFARLDSFEAMLFDSFADTPRRRLATILRLWVNLLRAGKLITVDIVRGVPCVLFLTSTD